MFTVAAVAISVCVSIPHLPVYCSSWSTWGNVIGNNRFVKSENIRMQQPAMSTIFQKRHNLTIPLLLLTHGDRPLACLRYIKYAEAALNQFKGTMLPAQRPIFPRCSVPQSTRRTGAGAREFGNSTIRQFHHKLLTYAPCMRNHVGICRPPAAGP